MSAPTPVSRAVKPPVAMAPGQRRPDIQGLRAIAILLVVVFHAGLPLDGGFVGVDVFFVISGFVITTMLVRARASAGGLDLRDFFARRIRRLVPALAVMVAATVVASALILSPIGIHEIVVISGLGALLMFANIAIARSTGGYFNTAGETNPLLHTWTLSLEGQFYLVFALLLVLGWWITRRSKSVHVTVILVAAVTVASLAVALADEAGLDLSFLPDWLIGFYGLLGRSWEFGVGALLALLALRLPPLSRRDARVLGFVGLALIAVGAAISNAGTVYPGSTTIVPVAGAALVLYSGRTTESPVARLLALRPFVVIGDISYSWYLWHWPFILFANALWPATGAAAIIAAAVSIVPAFLSYRWVEQPFTRRDNPRGLRSVALLLVPALAIVGALHLAVLTDFGSPRVAELRESQRVHAGTEAGCLTVVPIDDSTAEACTWNPDASGTPIYLIGDSVVEHYSDGLILAAEQLGRPLTVATAPGCPPYRISSGSTGDDLTEQLGCAPYIDGTLGWLDDQPPGVVVLGANDVAYWMPSSELPSDDTVESRRLELGLAITTTVEHLQQHGHTVVLAKAPPSYLLSEPRWRPTDCTLATIDAGRCRSSEPLESVEKVQSATRVVIDEVAASTGSAIFDPRGFFCSSTMCSTERNGVAMYHDDVHISVAASRLLEPLWIDVLAPLG